MKASRLFNLGAAVIISAIQWAVFFSPALSTRSDGLPVVVVTGHRQT